MKNNYTFCKKNGELKKFYIPVCKYITEAKMAKHEIMVGRYDEVVDIYSCYTTPRIELYAKDRRSYVYKIYEICKNFDVETKEWYSFRDVSVEFHGENVEKMLIELKELLGGVSYT